MPASRSVSAEDLVYVRDARALVEGDPAKGAHLLLWIIAGALAAFIVWASLAHLDEATRGIGKVIPSASLQTIQNLEGGILAELLVKEGQRVAEGDVLVRIDDTLTRASYREDLSKQQALRAALARLDAEAHGLDRLGFPGNIVTERPDLVERETSLFDKRASELRDRVATLEASIRLASEELALTAPLVAKEVMPKVDQLKLERELVVTRGELSKLTTGFRRDAMEQFNTTKAEIERLEESLNGRQDRMKRTVVRSPVSGTVNHLHIKTLGGVIQPGQAIVDIVPDGDSLLVEARIRPADIGFIHPGQEAMVKFTAYDFGTYGGLRGVVEHIGADTIEYEVDRQHYYMIKVRNTSGRLIKNGVELPIIPGMVAEVDVLTGRRTVLEYLLRPVNRVRANSLRER